MERRRFIQGLASVGIASSLAACSSATSSRSGGYRADGLSYLLNNLAPVDATSDRIIATNICTRPFRERGPRVESVTVGSKQLIHNYGHGGSGWSLSWGNAAHVRSMIQAPVGTPIAIVGCGAIGLTTAIECLRAGYPVTIYAKERPPYVRSSFATGIWSPDSRIVTLEHAAGFAETWQKMASHSYYRFQTLLGLPGTPVEWTPMFRLADKPFGSTPYHAEGEPNYPKFSKQLLGHLTPKARDLPSNVNPFPAPYVRHFPLLMFNISAYSQYLLDQYHRLGGKLETATLTTESDFMQFDQAIVINSTGYGAKALLNDDSLIPVRGQTCKLIPQPEVNYGLQYFDQHTSVYPRRDGLLVQAGATGDFGNDSERIDPAESQNAVKKLADIMQQMKLS